MIFVTSEMVVLSVMVSSRIPTKSVQIVQVITFLGSANQLERISLPKLNFYPYTFSRILFDNIQVQNEKFAQGDIKAKETTLAR